MKPCDWQLSLRNLSPEPPQTRYVHKAKPNPKPGPRRTKSLPVPKHMIPSVNPGLVVQVSKPELKAEPDIKISEAKDPVMEVSYSENQVEVSEPEVNVSEQEPKAENPVIDSESEVKVSGSDVKVSEPEIKDSEMDVKGSDPQV